MEKAAKESQQTPPPAVVPDKDCDLVMQGGIASGMVYPPAILELYRQGYRFHNIGGTSAGAIAAGFTAAAEYGRDIATPSPPPKEKTPAEEPVEGGFHRLQVVQALIGAAPDPGRSSFLRNLFQPHPQARPLMNAALALTQKGVAAKAAALAKTLWTDLPVPALLGTLGGAALWLAFRLADGSPRTGPAQAASALGLAAAGIGGALAGGAAGLWRRLTITLPNETFFGVVTGHAQDAAPCKGGLLTDWMAWAVNYLAGLCDEAGTPAPGASPLTFGDLAGLDDGSAAVAPDYKVQLKMVTSNLSQGQPYDLPFRDFLLLFKDEEMGKLFPKSIVDALIAGASDPPRRTPGERGPQPGGTPPRSPREQVIPPRGYHFVPEWQALPIAFAMRLSLSVPVFISAVPLYTVQAAALEELKPGGTKTLTEGDLQKNWFSDGGLCSNFPIHFFDAWLPRWPTFGINLLSLYRPKDASPAKVEEDARRRASAPVRATGGLASPRSLGESAQMAAATQMRMAGGTQAAMNTQSVPVHLPRADDPISAEWTEFTALFPFCFAVLTTAKGWQDALAAQLPSYRERIVQVRLASDTGGLNLDMTPAQVTDIVNLGAQAGRALQEFHPEHHQWVRYRVLMGQLEKQLQALRADDSPQRPIDLRVDYDALGQEQLAGGFPYPQPQGWLDETNAIMDQLKDLIAGWQPHTFGKDSPLPEPTLRVTPDV